ncbi:MAG: CRISPR system precrRNA processing endoribonuclease RAMP protein Cas6 [Pyrinomonadaceae bacterium]
MLKHFYKLPLAEYEFQLVAREDTICFPILGSTLRGAFGGALKDVSCTAAHRKCEICLLNRACHYTGFFEPQAQKNAPRPFTFQIPIPPLNPKLSLEDSLKMRINKGSSLPFGMTIFGADANKRLPYIIAAVSRMARKGLGMPRASFYLEEVSDAGKAIYTAESERISDDGQARTNLAEFCEKRLANLKVGDSLKLRFLMPVWLREEQKLVEKPQFFHLVKFLFGRLKNMFGHFADGAFDFDESGFLDESRRIEISGENLWRHDFEFYSNRRGKKERQTGVLGEMTFEGKNLKMFLPLLAAGEVLHVGSKTTFGLGQFKIV